MSCRDEILKTLRWSGKPLPVHEMPIVGHSQNAIASRMCELEREGLVYGTYPEGKRYKVWSLQKADGDQLVMI